MLKARPQEWRHLITLFAVVASVYFATFTGVTASNDGSHYALVRALVERRSVEISPYLAFAENQDYAVGPSGRYSDRPPGTALWTAPFYALAGFLPAPTVDLPSNHDRGNPRLLAIGAACAIAAAGAVVVFWLLLRELGLGLFARGLATIALAFGTATWKYGSSLYSHGLSALCVLLGLLLALRVVRRPRIAEAAALGFVLASSVTVEYTNLLLGVAVVTYATALLTRSGRLERRTAAAFAIGALPPAAFLAYYNWSSFGAPWRLSTFQVDVERWPNAANAATMFATPLSEGLVGMLWWGRDNQGLFLLSPIAALSLLGVRRLFRARPREATLILGLFFGYLLLFSTSSNFNPLTNDGRYLVPFLALWLVPLAYWTEEVSGPGPSDGARLLASLLLFGLLFLSVRNAFMHVAFSWNYDLRYRDLLDGSTPWPNVVKLLSTVFPNAVNLWWLWLGFGPALAVAWFYLGRNARELDAVTAHGGQPLARVEPVQASDNA